MPKRTEVKEVENGVGAVMVRLPKELKKAFAIKCLQKDTNQQEVVLGLVKEWTERK